MLERDNLIYLTDNITSIQIGSNYTTSFDIFNQSCLVSIIKLLLLCIIIVAAVLGNLLVIASVLRYQSLRTRANTFIVSLAFADLLVALVVMPFSASQEVAERWLFNRLTCDVFNANDVLFSTASLLNLCCISMDRYIAITDPFNYTSRMSKRKIIIIIIGVWTASILVSHLPIHLKLYATTTAIDDEMCSFQVNAYYGIISSLVSFWSPTIVMLFTYKKIFSEAQRQVKQIESLRPKTPPSPNIALNDLNSKEILKRGTQDIPDSSPPASDGSNKSNNSNVYISPRLSVSSNHLIVASQSKRNKNNCPNLKMEAIEQGLFLKKSTPPNFKRSLTNLFQIDSKSQNTSIENRRRFSKEHKAAKTLGVIMGVFLGCWLPFFSWYLTSSICQEYCDTPKVVVSILFWVGYTNSALNPIIYACFNREFRGAFRRQLCYYKRWTNVGRTLEIIVCPDKHNWRWSNDISSFKKEEV